MKNILTLVLALFLLSSLTQAQEYVRLMEEQNANFYDIQKSFYEHWKGKSYEKGKGWKQFKRWEYFMEPRVYPSGRIINPSLAFNEYEKFKTTYSSKKSTNNKVASWSPLGPSNLNVVGWNPGIGRVNAITVDPNNSNTIYIGAPAGGCWKTNNNGNSWTPLTDDFSSLGVSGIAIDHNNSDIVYLATGDGDGNDTYSIGVMKSTDGGITWNTTGLNWVTTQARVMRKIIINPNNSNILFVATSSGLYKTTDAGANWISILTGSIRDVEFNPNNPNTIFTCTKTQFYKSTNGGTSFANISSGVPNSNVGRLSIAVTVNDTNYVYLLAANSTDAGFLGLFRSTDGGSSFTLRTSSPNVFGYNTSGGDSGGQSWYDMALAVSPTNKNEVYTGGINVWKSTNGGTTLNCLSQWNWPTGSYEYVHADIHTIDFYGNTLFVGSDGGIFKSTNNGNNFSDITSGIQHSQLYRMGGSTTNSGTILVGAQDNGCSLLKNGVWTHVTGGDGMECIVDYSNANIMYSTSQNGNVYKSTDGGNSFNVITGGINGSGAWVTPYTLDPVNANTIYLGYNDIWKSTNGGNTWNTISSFNSTELKSLVVAPSNNDVIYAASDNSIKKTIDGGTNWSNITSGLPGNAITYISIHNLNPNILWVSLSGFTNGEKVYKSTDGGITWNNISGNLPNLPVNCITYEYGSNNGTYIGTDIGIYYKNDDLSLWQLFNDNLPNVIVYELEIHYGSSKIRAATYGRGLWESSLFITAPPNAQFLSPDTNICPNNCAQFTNNTPNLGMQWQWHFTGGTPNTSTDLNPLICYPTSGNYDVSLIVSNPLGSDSIYASNYIKVQSQIIGNPPPLIEGFENSSTIPANWTIINPDNSTAWSQISSIGGYGLSSSCIHLDNFSINFNGEKDDIKSPPLDFSNVTNLQISFDHAYKQWSPARSDTLTIYYSLDCGLTKTILWEKGGPDLATANYSPLYFIPTASQWESDTINLIGLVGQSSVELLFENKSNNGNVLYLDNINVSETSPVGLKKVSINNTIVFPNPFNNTITLKNINNPINYIEIYNSIGKLVFNKKDAISSNRQTLNLNHFSSGFYLIKIGTNEGIMTKSLIKN